MKLSLVYAQLDNGSLGYAGPEPMAWNIPEDLQHFKELTMGNALLMGSNTFDSLPCLLPGRFHFVLTKRKGLHRLGHLHQVQFVPSIDEAIRLAEEMDFPWLVGIGGADVASQMVSRVEVVHRTVIRGVVLTEKKMQISAPDLEAYGFEMTDQQKGQTPGVWFQTWVKKVDE